jgi:predicted HicB family RNase H-like nuclease
MIKLVLRIPEHLHEELKKIAEQEKRSINSEILHIIEQYILNFTKKQN